MKKLLVGLVLVGATQLLILGTAQAQSDNSDKQAIAMLREFYTAYMTASSGLPAPASLNQLFALPKKYCTANLLRELKAQEYIEADPFLAAQDSDIRCLKTLQVSKDSKGINNYVVSYKWPNTSDKIVIHLSVLKQGKEFKISAIK